MSQAGTPCVVVLGGYLTEPAPITLTEGTRWLNAFWQNFKQQMSGQVTCEGALFRNLTSQGAQVLEVPAPTGPVGVNAGQLALAGASVLVKWTTSNGSRRGRGRTYVPGIPEGHVSAGGRLIEAGSIGGWLTAANAYITSMEPADGVVSAAVLSRADGVARQITTASVVSQVAVQKRRMR